MMSRTTWRGEWADTSRAAELSAIHAAGLEDLVEVRYSDGLGLVGEQKKYSVETDYSENRDQYRAVVRQR